MPNYYNPYNYIYPANYVPGYAMQPTTMIPQVSGGQSNTGQYMINVDGEGSARAWQPQVPVGPNTIIPLWDLDGQHVYFKSTDAYGRMNPIRKGRVVFEDEPQILPQNSPNGSQSASPTIDTSAFVTKNDLDALKQELKNMFFTKNQNGRQNDQNRGDNR